jgi:hypothetical protein
LPDKYVKVLEVITQLWLFNANGTIRWYAPTVEPIDDFVGDSLVGNHYDSFGVAFFNQPESHFYKI